MMAARYIKSLVSDVEKKTIFSLVDFDSSYKETLINPTYANCPAPNDRWTKLAGKHSGVGGDQNQS